MLAPIPTLTKEIYHSLDPDSVISLVHDNILFREGIVSRYVRETEFLLEESQNGNFNNIIVFSMPIGSKRRIRDLIRYWYINHEDALEAATRIIAEEKINITDDMFESSRYDLYKEYLEAVSNNAREHLAFKIRLQRVVGELAQDMLQNESSIVRTKASDFLSGQNRSTFRKSENEPDSTIVPMDWSKINRVTT